MSRAIFGLENLGNTCFFNSLFIALSSCESFINYLENHQSDIHALNLIQQVVLGKQARPQELFNEFVQRNSVLGRYEQQDAHEVFYFTMKILEECEIQSGFAETNNPFCGLFAQFLSFRDCLHSAPVRLSVFSSISLAIDQRRMFMKTTIYDCLKSYTDQERLSDVFCDSCKEKKDISVKQILIARPPKILCLHLTRMIGDGKITKFVAFPQTLDFGTFIANSSHYSSAFSSSSSSSGSRKIRYELTSVIVHHGSSRGGHYTTFRKLVNSRNVIDDIDSSEEWFHISDNHVSKVDLKTVFSAQAYMLFYEKIESFPLNISKL
jgi:ubiquitin C-terminal hydrolase